MVETAESRLLRSAGSGEANCQSHIQHWLYEKGIRRIKASWSTPAGRADLYLPNRRCIIEVKDAKRLRGGPYKLGTGSPNVDRPNESAFGQVERYVLAERTRFSSSLDVYIPNQSWLGIVTDGSEWWAWEWPPIRRGNCKRKKPAAHQMRLTEQTAGLLADLIKRKHGRKWAPPVQGCLTDYAQTIKTQVLRHDCLAF